MVSFKREEDLFYIMKFYRTASAACKAYHLVSAPGCDEIEKRYPVLVNDYYLKLTDPALGSNDPIRRQWHPDPAELDDEKASVDPLAEGEQSPVSRLIHRYDDRAVLLVTGKCAMRCRFCFRKRTWTTGSELDDISDNELDEATNYLKAHPQVREVLISGGDPLMLPASRLKQIFDALRRTGTLEVIRVASRLPAVCPELVTQEKIALLAEVPGLWLATHFNHPREVSPEAVELCGKLIRNAVPIINQTVLLKGVNDDDLVLEELFRKLIAIKVKPHYLFHVDPVRGVRHFATGVQKGLDILRAFRPRLSSLAVPTYAIDLPEGGGKVALQPEYGCDGVYRDIRDSKEVAYYKDMDL